MSVVGRAVGGYCRAAMDEAPQLRRADAGCRFRLQTARLLLFLLALLPLAGHGSPAVSPEALAASVHAIPASLKLARDIAEVPLAVGKILQFPLGLLELIFSPLPDLTVKRGLSHMAKGIVGPFDFARAVLRLPMSTVQALDHAVRGPVPGALRHLHP